jgi:DNA-3-methyladenine glycosylase II
MGSKRFEIQVPAPFRLDLTVWALRRTTHNEMDGWDGGTWRRTLLVEGGVVGIRVTQSGTTTDPRVTVRVDGEDGALGGDIVGFVCCTVSRMLGLELDLRGFYQLADRDPPLRALASRFSGMRPPRFASVLEAVVNAVACQQLSLDVGIHLLNRLARRLGPSGGGTHGWPALPSAGQLARAGHDEVRALGFSNAKARTLITLGQRVATGELDLERLRCSEDVTARDALVALPGIGRWSAEYTLLRGLGRLEVLPGDDIGVQNSLRHHFDLGAGGGYADVARLAQRWWPYAGLVYLHLLLDRLETGGHLGPTSGSHEGTTEPGRPPAPRRAIRRS